MAPFSDLKDVATALRKNLSAKADRLIYDPSRPPGRVASGGGQVINIYEPSPIKPPGGRGPGDPRQGRAEKLLNQSCGETGSKPCQHDNR